MSEILQLILQFIRKRSAAIAQGRKRIDPENRIRVAKERALESTPETIQFMN